MLPTLIYFLKIQYIFWMRRPITNSILYFSAAVEYKILKNLNNLCYPEEKSESELGYIEFIYSTVSHNEVTRHSFGGIVKRLTALASLQGLFGHQIFYSILSDL
jgi:hypothetical protein